MSNTADFVPAPEAVPAIERNIVGAILRDPSILGELTQLIQPEDFESFVCRSLFGAAVSLWLDGKPVDHSSVYSFAVRQGLDQDVHPVDLVEIHQNWWCSNPVYYAHQIRQHSLIRRLAEAGMTITDLAKGRSGPAEHLLGEAERLLMSLATVGSTGSTETIEKAIVEELARLDKGSQRQYPARNRNRLRGPRCHARRLSRLGVDHRRRSSQRRQNGIRTERGPARDR
jgi:replicative DNA helicase